MSLNYAKGKPVGNNAVPFFDSPPAVKALVARLIENAVVSSVITFGHNTTSLEVVGTAQPTLLRWIGTADTEASVTAVNYDHVIPPNTVRRFVIPIEGANAGGAPNASIVGQLYANGLFRRCAIKTPILASVYSSEYGNSNSY